MGPTAKRRSRLRHPKGRRQNNSGQLYFRADRQRWIAEVIIDGHSMSRSSKSRDDAERKLEVLLRHAEEHTLATTGRQTLGQYLAGWLTSRKARKDIRAGSYAAYRTALRYAVEGIGMIALEELRPMHIQRLYDQLSSEHSPNTLLNLHTTLRAALDQAVELDLMVGNPARKVRAPKVPKRVGRRHLSLPELERLLEVSRGTRWHALWAVLGLAGLRNGEAIALRWEDIDWHEDLLTVDETLTSDWDQKKTVGPPKTETSDRVVEMGKTVRDALWVHRTLMGSEGYSWEQKALVFLSVRGKRLNSGTVWTMLHQHCEEAGIEPISPHVLRHTAATLLLEDTPIHVAKELLGHASVQMTVDLYGHTDRVMRRAAMERLDQRLKKES